MKTQKFTNKNDSFSDSGSELEIIYTIGYLRWPTPVRLEKFLATLVSNNNIKTLIDIRHSPCSSQLSHNSNYGPKAWNLSLSNGIEQHLRKKGINYIWIPELGNPQKNDKNMEIFRSHINSCSTNQNIPAQRGLLLLEQLLTEEKNKSSCCLLCACKDFSKCHRTVVSHELLERNKNFKVINL